MSRLSSSKRTIMRKKRSRSSSNSRKGRSNTRTSRRPIDNEAYQSIIKLLLSWAVVRHSVDALGMTC